MIEIVSRFEDGESDLACSLPRNERTVFSHPSRSLARARASHRIIAPRHLIARSFLLPAPCSPLPLRSAPCSPLPLRPAPCSLLPAPRSLSRAPLALQRKAARTWQHVLPRRPASTAAPPAAPRSRSA